MSSRIYKSSVFSLLSGHTTLSFTPSVTGWCLHEPRDVQLFLDKVVLILDGWDGSCAFRVLLHVRVVLRRLPVPVKIDCIVFRAHV